MHPIERLRYVARAAGADAESLVRETAGALRGLGLDTAGLVVACRRIVERHPTCGPLWWLCARMLTSSDPMAAARAAVEEIECDDDDRSDRRAARRRDRGDDRLARAGRRWRSPGAATSASRRRRRPSGDVVRAAPRAGEIDSELVPTESAARHRGRRPGARRGRGVDATTRVAGTGSAVLAAVAGLHRDTGVVRRRTGPPAAGPDARTRSSSGSPTSPSTRGRGRRSSGADGPRWHVVGPAGRTAGGRGVRAECEMAPELLRTGIM